MRSVFLLLVVLTGCPAPEGDDAPDPDGPSTDATTLQLSWVTRPEEIPGEVTSETTLDVARFELTDLRVVGDAGPGDPRTSIPALTLVWDAMTEPAVVELAEAPPGIYSRISFDLGAGDGLLLEGSAQVRDAVEPFTIRDVGAVAISFELGALEIMPGEQRVQILRVELAKVLGAIDFEQLPVVSGRRVLQDPDPQVAEVRDRLRESFSDDNSN